jgi:hypothetical protein
MAQSQQPKRDDEAEFVGRVICLRSFGGPQRSKVSSLKLANFRSAYPPRPPTHPIVGRAVEQPARR